MTGAARLFFYVRGAFFVFTGFTSFVGAAFVGFTAFGAFAAGRFGGSFFTTAEPFAFGSICPIFNPGIPSIR
jgi:hypothetical protein